MDAIDALKTNILMNQGIALGVLSKASPEALRAIPAGSTINSAGATLVHAVWIHDSFLHGLIGGGQPLYVRNNWVERTGIPYPSDSFQNLDWGAGIHMDPATFRPYAEEVFASAEATLNGMTGADVDRLIQAGPNKIRAGEFLAGIASVHLSQHVGEASALLGIQGIRVSEW